MGKESEAITGLAEMVASVVDTGKVIKDFVEKWADDFVGSPLVTESKAAEPADRIAFTEERIRAVMAEHYTHLSVDHFIELLKTEEI